MRHLRLTEELELIEIKKYPLKNKLFKISLILNALLIIGLFFNLNNPITKIIYKQVAIERFLPEDIELTDSAILQELVKQKCILPQVALAQMKLETGHFTSDICKENKNIAGIRTSTSSYVIGQNRGHCVYKTYKDCIRDYIRIQERYLKNIDGKYAESKEYLQHLRTIK